MVLKKLSIEIFIKRKLEQEKPVLTECLSFKTLVTYKKNFNFTLDNHVCCEAPFVRYNLIAKSVQS